MHFILRNDTISLYTWKTILRVKMLRDSFMVSHTHTHTVTFVFELFHFINSWGLLSTRKSFPKNTFRVWILSFHFIVSFWKCIPPHLSLTRNLIAQIAMMTTKNPDQQTLNVLNTRRHMEMSKLFHGFGIFGYDYMVDPFWQLYWIAGTCTDIRARPSKGRAFHGISHHLCAMCAVCVFGLCWANFSV